ncbi:MULTISPECIES: DUF5703 family protein [Actinokineospora]|jgi:hypothetical protein|uniref:Dihydroorotate dehydrogenase n=2 Tax=Actinokineospora TaxID=39845 RepID=A0A1H0FK25_9PSEU|nr:MULTISPECIES: DUF5703 family protein [Actinokineospora]MBC6446040.1 hypothetical protein [Actinokineospora xionganensis]TDP69510.1 hypothetical protein C8E96_5098 [Actinokineospora alba]SDI15185.1 hypothetical protein SAMN05421871_103468 [Actinokineospora alba]SDN94950.1 hypothetical protein SAMN05192558_101402 [Actinokineospora alba]
MSDGVVEGDWEYRPLRLPPAVSRLTAATQLAIHAEFAGWELSNVRLYSDGTRKVWLRRKRRPHPQPGIIT